MEKIKYIDRFSRQIKEEKVFGGKALALFYGNGWVSKIIFFLFRPFIVKTAFFSRIYGFLQKRKNSASKVPRFIQKYEIDSSEFVKTKFNSFNDFFIRKLKPMARPIQENSTQVVLPADGRYLVYPNLSEVDGFFVKGKRFELIDFLHDATLAKKYERGSMVIARLCPVDYHRFHFPIDCVPSQAKLINGYLYSVNIWVLKKNIQYLTQNKRYISCLNTKNIGTVLFVEIGATNVGSVHQTYTPNSLYRKGEEKGYFSFGGSCIVMLFEPNQIEFDQDLVEASAKKIEVKGLLGQSLARCK